MRLTLWVLLFLGLFAFTQFSVVRAEDVDVEDVDDDIEINDDDDDEDMEDEYGDDYDDDDEFALGSSSDVSISYVLPDWPDARVVVGEKITVLFNFDNNGLSTFNVTSVGAHLHSPYDYSYFIQNYTQKEIGVPVGPGQQLSVDYVFLPQKLEPLELWMSAWVEYVDTDDRLYRSTFYNTTLELIEEQSVLDVKQFFTYVIGVAVIGLIAYFVANNTQSGKKMIKSSKSSIAAASSSETSSSGWGAAYKRSEKSNAARRSSRKPRKTE
jgi:hypothetical protein